MTSDDAKKKELLNILDRVDSDAAKIESMGQNMIQVSRLSRDLAVPMRTIINELPNGLQIGLLDSPLASWRDWQATASHLLNLQSQVSLFTAVSSGTSSTTITFAANITAQNFNVSERTQDAKTKIYQVLERSPQVEQVRLSMTRLGLDANAGTRRTALELLNEAQAAIDRPMINDGSPTSILISLRESIDSAITALIRRRPVQEKASSWSDKVLSLGRHCAISGLPVEHFPNLATDISALMDSLSGSKQGSFNRGQINELFVRGVTTFKALLTSIDESKLR